MIKTYLKDDGRVANALKENSMITEFWLIVVLCLNVQPKWGKRTKIKTNMPFVIKALPVKM